MLRRHLLQAMHALLGTFPLSAFAMPQAKDQNRLAAAWRTATGSGPDAGRDFAGILELDWSARRVRIASQVVLPERVHGLLAQGDGGFLAVGARPGRVLLRFDAAGQIAVRHSLQDESPPRTLAGHANPSLDGQWLYTPETDPVTGLGWISVRSRASLQKVAEWRSHGIDPHQCLPDSHGALLLANGGIPRTRDGSKRDTHQMAPSLVRLDAHTGELLGQWQLADHRLSLRHLAWSRTMDTADAPLLGIGLQAEHDDPLARSEAPGLAVWDGFTLRTPSHSALAGGYAGDIAPGPGGGFIVSGQKVGRGVLWHPDAPGELHTIAQLRELCALAVWENNRTSSNTSSNASGILIGAARGVARWHPTMPPVMLTWPQEMSPDNHWVLLT